MVQRLIEQALREQRAGRLDEARALCERALESQPRHADALHLAGVLALQGGAFERAIGLIEQATEVQPENPVPFGNLAQAYLAVRRIADAQAAYRRAAALDPREPQFAVGAANCLALQGNLAQAESELRAVTERHRRYALGWFNLGNVLRLQGRRSEAADMYRRVIRLDPASADAYNHLGCVLHESDQFDAAEQAYRRYLSLRPHSTDAYFNLASLWLDRGRAEEAARFCRQGIEKCADSAGAPELQSLLGSALEYQGRFAAALVAFRAALASDPDDARAIAGYGVALLQTGNTGQGLRWLARALEREPDSPEFRHAIAGVYLGLGDLQSGWREYQWRPARRLFLENSPQVALASDIPAALAGKRLLVLREQGLGDELFFLRFTAEIKSRGAFVTYYASASIASLLGRVAALDQVITEGASLPAADYTVLAGDLPRLLAKLDCTEYRAPPPSPPEPPVAASGSFTRLPRIFYPPMPPPLALTALPKRLEEMRERLSGLGSPPYRGLTWRAGTVPEQQRGRSWVLHKEVPLEQLGATLRGVGGSLIALQRHPRHGELERLAAQAAVPVHDFTALNDDLETMLALLALIDDYIGVSNTNMHLRAGAGRAARVLLPRPAEWRWMISGSESPWFAGFRLYRQGVNGDWNDALMQLRNDLATPRTGQPSGARPPVP